MSLGCGITPNEHSPSKVIELDIDSTLDNIDNNDGISIFDVTVPGDPKYAMMQLSEFEDYEVDDGGEIIDFDTSSDGLQPDTILNASDYLLWYRHDAADDLAMTRTQELDALPQLDAAALASVWHDRKFRDRKTASDIGTGDPTLSLNCILAVSPHST